MAVAGEHAPLVVAAGIAHRDAEQEPVELAFGQRIGAFELERVLRGDDQERPRQRQRLAIDRDLPFAHRFQQGRLRPRRGAVDLVGQHDVGEDRPAVKDELALLAVEDAAAQDVAGQAGRA